jgi:ATP-dependent Clp protease protease subunit
MQNTSDIVKNPVVPVAPATAKIYESVSEIFGEWFAVRMVHGVARVSIFGEIGCTRPWEELIAEVKDAKDIKIFVDSVGGNIVAGVELFHALTGRVSEATILNRCFSSALPIALAGKKIRMERHARILCHAPHSWIYGDADQMILSARRLQKYSAYLKKIIMERTELSETVVAGWLNGADVYFTAEQAVAYGLADEIFDAPKSDPCDAPVATADAGTVQPCGMTEDELFALDVLAALPRLTVRNRQNFLREVCASLFYNCDELPKENL